MSDLFGIDVGVGSIKTVSLSKSGNGVFLDAIGEVKNPAPEWIKNGIKSKDWSEVASSVKLLFNDLKAKPKQIVASLPEDEVISRLIRLPPLKDNEIIDALKFEAETFVPYPLDQVSIDYEVVEKDNAGRLSVFAIAAKNETIQLYVKLFKSLGMDLAALESPAVAMKRVINHSVEAVNSVMLVDMGEKYSDVVSLNNKKVYFTRSKSVGGESLTRAISINLGLDMSSAEEYKKAYGMKEMQLEGKIRQAIQPVFVSMAEELRKAIVSYREELNKSIELLVLSGGGANMPGLTEELAKVLGIEVQVVQPFLKIDTKKVVLPININADGCRFSLAAGLAMRGLEDDK